MSIFFNQRRGAPTDAISNVTDSDAAADLRRQMVEWRDNVAKYQDKCGRNIQNILILQGTLFV